MEPLVKQGFGLDNIYWSGGGEILKVYYMNVPSNKVHIKR